MKMLLYAGASDENVKKQSRDIDPTLRLRANDQEFNPEMLVGKTIKVIKNNPILGLIIEVEEEK